MFAVAGYVNMLESVFFLNVEVFVVSDSLGERITPPNQIRGWEDVNYFRFSIKRDNQTN